jgi:hypothetical protein
MSVIADDVSESRFNYFAGKAGNIARLIPEAGSEAVNGGSLNLHTPQNHLHRHVGKRLVARLSQRQIVALAGEFYREMAAAHRDNPGAPADWEAAINLDAKRKKRLTTLQPRVIHYRFTFEKEVNEFLEGRDLALSGETFDAFVSAYLEAKEQVAKYLMQNAAGNYRPDPDAERFPGPSCWHRTGKVGALEMLDRYPAEAGLSPKTYSAWKAKISALIAFAKHDDLALLTARKVIEWKDDLLTEKPDGSKLDTKTVRNGYLAALKATSASIQCAASTTQSSCLRITAECRSRAEPPQGARTRQTATISEGDDRRKYRRFTSCGEKR